jgi:protease I
MFNRGNIMHIKGKKIVMIIAPSKFRDEELFETREYLEKHGAKITVASKTTGTATGMLGGTAKIDMNYADIDTADYDAVIFVGGGGAEDYFDDPRAHSIAKSAFKQKKLVCAICIAPSILANAGLLEGRKATVWEGDKYVGLLKKGGAEYTAKPVQRHGRIITGNGPKAAQRFAEKIAEQLES